jgi:hypothetical protein
MSIKDGNLIDYLDYYKLVKTLQSPSTAATTKASRLKTLPPSRANIHPSELTVAEYMDDDCVSS